MTIRRPLPLPPLPPASEIRHRNRDHGIDAGREVEGHPAGKMPGASRPWASRAGGPRPQVLIPPQLARPDGFPRDGPSVPFPATQGIAIDVLLA